MVQHFLTGNAVQVSPSCHAALPNSTLQAHLCRVCLQNCTENKVKK